MTLRSRMIAIASGALALVVLGVALLVTTPAPVLQGWLTAFVFWSGIPVGSLVLLLIHRLTGGRWGEALAPALRPLALGTPLAALAFLPIAFALSVIFPWAAQPEAAPPGVADYYLNAAGFLVRAIVALGGWSVLAVLFATGRGGRLTAAFGLVFHGLVISMVAVDWILSVDPGFSSTAFAAGIAFQQILSALAFVAMVAPEREGSPVARDLGGLLIATLLGVVYIDFMSYVVAWYGNLPDKAAWYLARGTTGWSFAISAAVVVGAIVPLGLLLVPRLRASREALRGIGALILLGVWLHVLWLLVPAFQPGAFVWAWVALAAMLLVGVGLTGSWSSDVRRWRPAHAA
ncbi:MAG: hypothetical protein R3D62_08225 [Xanthobacteraceae bacterium]